MNGLHTNPGGSDLSKEVLRSYLDLFPTRRTPFHEQHSYAIGDKNDWYAVKDVDLSLAHVRQHLQRDVDYWIACRSALDGDRPVTPFLLLDFDVDDGRDAAWARIQAVTNAFQREPFVSSSPSGGFHAIWFFDAPVHLASLVDLKHPQSRGLLPEVIRHVLGHVGAGFCEIYPQNRQVVRWPLGRHQHRVAFDSGVTVKGESAAELIAAAQQHRATAPALTLHTLRALRPPPAPVRQRARVHVTEEEVHAAGEIAVGIHPSTAAAAQKLYRDGLVGPNSRNDAMFILALAMVHDPEVLLSLGYDRALPPAEQLLAWLDAKHNGHSKEYPGDGTLGKDWWLPECQRIVANAETAGPLEATFPVGWRMLTDPEWDIVFGLPAVAGAAGLKPYRLEVVATCLLRKAKWSVMARGFQPAEDGTYSAEIHSQWWATIPFCASRRIDRQMRYRDALIQGGLFRPGEAGDANAKRANRYDGFRLVFGAGRPSLPYTPRELAWMARHLDVEPGVLEYGLVCSARFPSGAELQRRYGRRGKEYIQGVVADIEGAVVALRHERVI